VTSSDRPYQFFEPLWRRIAVLVFVAAWLAIELIYLREPMWSVIAGAMVAYAVWVFFLKWPKPPAG
jgi:hypothetical protein